MAAGLVGSQIIPSTGRYCLFFANAYEAFFEDLILNNVKKYYDIGDLFIIILEERNIIGEISNLRDSAELS